MNVYTCVYVLRTRIITLITCISTCLVFNATAGVQTTFYVSPDGNDSNPGTESSPFKTVSAARDAVRMENSSMSGDIVIYLRDGTYPVHSTITFKPEDSGTNGYRIIYKAYPEETPILSGAVKVTGWTQHDGNIYKASLNRSTKLRNLYVNDKRAMMTSKTVTARGGEGSYSVNAGQADWAWTSGTKSDGVRYNASDVPLISRNPDDIEIVNGTTWNENIVCVRDVLTVNNNRVLQLQQPYGAIAQTPGWGAAFTVTGTHTIYNAFEFLDSPGEFYFDKSEQTLYYYARSGENMAAADVQAPVIEKLIEIQGDSPENRVRNITFEGITFANTEYNLVHIDGSYGKTTCQGADAFIAFYNDNWHNTQYEILDLLPGMINCSFCDSVDFIENTIKHSGNDGINMANDVINCNIIGNFITDITSSGITVGHPQHVYIGDGGTHARYAPDMEGICKNNRISNNVFYDISTAPGFGGCAAITAFFVEEIEITYNLVQKTAYNGIHLGWGWCNFQNSTTCKNNTISYNRIIDALQRLHDSGAIYTIGQMPGTVINENYVRGIPAATHGPTYGLHNDEGTTHITENDNVLDIDPGVKYTINCEDFGQKHHLTILRTFATVNKMGVNPPNSTIDPPVAVPDNVWPVKQYTTCVNSGIQDAYSHIIPEGLIPLQDYVFPASCAAQAASSIPVRSSGDSSNTIWFAPEGTTSFREGPSMTTAAGNETSINVPQRNGLYRLYVVNKIGQKSKESSALLRVSGSLSQIEAENYSSQFGIETENCSEGGEDIGFIENGDYVVYDEVDFGSGSTLFQVRAACGGNGGDIEIRIDSENGPLIGTCSITETGGWQTWSDFTCNISETDGKHGVYMKFTGGDGYLFNVNWFEFINDVTDIIQTDKNNHIRRFEIGIKRGDVFINPQGKNTKYSVSLFKPNGQLIMKKHNCIHSSKIPLKARGAYIVLINHDGSRKKRLLTHF